MTASALALPLTAPQTQALERLAYAGLIPFALLAMLMWLVTPDLIGFVAMALAAYGATVVSFLGGIHWGIALIQGGPGAKFHLMWGVVPALMAWVAIVMPADAGLPMLGLLLIGCYLVDRRTWTSPALRPWLTLRFRLTVVSTLCCVTAAANT